MNLAQPVRGNRIPSAVLAFELPTPGFDRCVLLEAGNSNIHCAVVVQVADNDKYLGKDTQVRDVEMVSHRIGKDNGGVRTYLKDLQQSLRSTPPKKVFVDGYTGLRRKAVDGSQKRIVTENLISPRCLSQLSCHQVFSSPILVDQM